MCGVFAELELCPAKDPKQGLSSVLASLRHRGPDAEGAHVVSGPGWRLRLAHTRLRILDLSSNAAQPMASRDGSLHLVFNGEIYNYLELRRELQGLGRVFDSASDTEVLLAALEEWRLEALPRLRGMFAFALHDAREGSLLLARDRFGVKPLYYALQEGRLTAASEIRAILASGNVDFEPDSDAVASYLAFGSVSGPRTMARGISELPAGTWLRFARGRVEKGRYWSLPGPPAGPAPSEDEAAREVERLLEDAVRSHLVSDVPLAAFLSSGMDSSAVVTCAARARGAALDTFTVGFGEADRGLDEAEGAAAFAQALGVSHHSVLLGADDCLGTLEPVLRAMDQPSMDGANTYVVSLAAKTAGFTVALSGLGGDEVFGGYPHLRFAHERAGWLRALASFGPFLRAAGRLATPFAGGDVRLAKAIGLLAGGGSAPALYAARRAMFLLRSSDGLFAPEHASRWRALGNEELLGNAGGAAGRKPLAQAETELEIGNYLANTLLRDTDAMAMRHGLEVRVPMLDHRLVEFVLQLPLAYRFKRGRLKPLLARALPDLPEPPPSGKKGFTLPFARWLRGPLAGEVGERLGRLEFAGEFVLPSGATRLWRRFLAGEDRLWTRAWTLYVLDRWLEERATAPARGSRADGLAEVRPRASSWAEAQV